MKETGTCILGAIVVFLIVAITVTVRHMAPYIAGIVVVGLAIWFTRNYKERDPEE